MKYQTPNHLGRATLQPLAPVIRVITVATILARFITPSPAIMVRLPSGARIGGANRRWYGRGRSKCPKCGNL
jgi:hypothetical protein